MAAQIGGNARYHRSRCVTAKSAALARWMRVSPIIRF